MTDRELNAGRSVQLAASVLMKPPADPKLRELLNQQYGSYCVVTARGALRTEKVLIGLKTAKKARGAANGQVVLVLAGYYEHPGDARERFEALFDDPELVGRLMAYHETRRTGSYLY